VQQRQHSRWPWLAGFLSLVIVLTGALAAGANASKDQQAACANIERFNLEKQMNAHAAQILASCGRSRTGSRAHSTSLSSLGLLAPSVYGGPDVNEITQFSAALHVKAATPDAATALIKYLSAPAAAPIIRKTGMDPG